MIRADASKSTRRQALALGLAGASFLLPLASHAQAPAWSAKPVTVVAGTHHRGGNCPLGRAGTGDGLRGDVQIPYLR